MFRAPLAGDETTVSEPIQHVTQGEELKSNGLDNEPAVHTSKHDESPSIDAQFGPFCLDDDIEPQQKIDSPSTSSIKNESDPPPDKSSVSSVSDHIDEEVHLRRDDSYYENGDDERNEDEAWSWQEYNAENFGIVEPPDESVLCPVCGNSIMHLPEHDRSAHVNGCLDLPPPAENENQVDGKALVDATVEQEMINVKREDSEPEVKLERNETMESRISMKEEIDDFGSDVDDTKDVKATAFDKIMVSHAEEKQWADAARTELNQRGTKYKTRVCPFYKILSPFPIAVDAFKYGTVPGIEGYYLTHFHSDHYGGLSSTWDAGPIYCSSITGSLVIQQLRVKPEYVVKLPMNTPTNINGVTVTLIDANHCPGSTLFLYEGNARGRDLRYLHCGDFRATPVQLLNPAIAGKKIDVVYLDTTYLSPKYAFPSQEEVIEACSHVCRDLAGLLPEGSNPVADARNSTGMAKFLNTKSAESMPAPRKRGRLLVVVGTYSIGKERIVLGIAKALGSKIFAAARKRDILHCLEDPDLESLITDDPLDAQVHMTYLQEIRPETLSDYLTQFLPHFQRIVGFRGTGWTYSAPKGRFLDNPTTEMIMSWNPRYTFNDMSPARGSTHTAACYGVPYSEHSSFRELMCFCLSCPARYIPTVNIGSKKSRERMKAWIDKWALETKKQGPRLLKQGQTTWS